jgi:hypothetical protein
MYREQLIEMLTTDLSLFKVDTHDTRSRRRKMYDWLHWKTIGRFAPGCIVTVGTTDVHQD